MAGWVNARQLEVIEFLREENRVLREQLGGRRLRFTDDQRRRLVVKGRIVGRRRLGEFAGLVTPDTILRWYRELIARKYDGSVRRQTGRPTVATDVEQLTGLVRYVVLFGIDLQTRPVPAQDRAKSTWQHHALAARRSRVEPAEPGLRAVGSPKMSVAPLQFLLLVSAGWVNRRQLEIVEYLQEENRVLREQLGDRRLRFTDAQRRRLATRAKRSTAAHWSSSPVW